MYDVIVIGAGTIGSFTANELAKLGHHVCVLEKNASAGAKNSCTGIVSSTCLQMLPGASGAIQHEAHSAKIFSPSGSFIRVDRESAQAYVLDRPALDRHMAARAAAGGAQYMFNALASDIEQNDGYLSITCLQNGEPAQLTAHAAVISCGFGCSLAAKLGLGRISYYAQGAQADVVCRDIDEIEVYSGRGIAPGFFAWLVPAGGNRAKAGLLSRSNPRPLIDSLLKKLSNDGKIIADDYHISYDSIPLKPLPKTYGDRFVVIGDAAGQVKPTTGGGIYFGLLAAREAVAALDGAIKSNDFSGHRLAQYQKRWRSLLGRELAIDYWAHRFYQKLDDSQVQHIFEVIERHGIHESLLTSPDVTFDWHSNIILDAIKHRSLQRSLERLHLKMPTLFKRDKRS
jgi:digeranylgeranylglycerophospholipid reductase